jgi:hypothetical protein
MTAIINNGQKFGTLNGVLTLNSEIKKVVFKAIKENKATKLIDTEETLMYEIEL